MSVFNDYKKEVMEAAHNERIRLALSRAIASYRNNTNDALKRFPQTIEMAKEVRGKIVTNDSNLNKVAELQGIEVLNINELANSLKPVVLPGEEMNVKILKEGKEIGQGVAYLDDGTMIVVDNGRKHMGKVIDVIVTSVLQTPAGRMIFARLKEEANRETRGKDYYYPLDSEF